MASNPDEGRRQALLEKQRTQLLQDVANQKQALQQETERRNQSASARFTSRIEGVDEQLKKSTIGLVTLDEFRRTRNDIEEAQRREAAQAVTTDEAAAAESKKLKKRKKEKKGQHKVALSFNPDGSDDEDGASRRSTSPSTTSNKKQKLTKNPTIDTSFLPDRDREARERTEREALRRQWLETQERVKNEVIEITYSYWDGTGHRKTVEVRVPDHEVHTNSIHPTSLSQQCKKGDTIGQFLEKCRAQFQELRGTSVDNMMYIKEDLIIPHVSD